MLVKTLASPLPPVNAVPSSTAAKVGGGSPPLEGARVLVLAPLPPPIHGVAVMFDTLLRQLADREQFTFFHSPVGATDKGQEFGRFTAGNAATALYDLIRAARRLHMCRPQVAYLSLSQNAPAFLRDSLLILLCRAFGARVVAHIHGAYFDQFRAGLPWVLRILVDRILSQVERLVVLGECLREIGGPAVSPDRVVVVPNGVDLGPAPERSPMNAPFTVLYMGVLEETKGFLELIRAWPRVRESIPGAQLVCAGRWDSDEIRDRTFQALEDLGVQDCVELPGVVTGESKSALFARVSAFCMPTFYPLEGQPVVILEAMAAGLPVVTTARGAIAEVVVDRVTGFLIPAHDPNALVERLSVLAHDSSLRERLGRAAMARYRREFTAAHFAHRIESVLLDAAGIPATHRRHAAVFPRTA